MLWHSNSAGVRGFIWNLFGFDMLSPQIGLGRSRIRNGVSPGTFAPAPTAGHNPQEPTQNHSQSRQHIESRSHALIQVWERTSKKRGTHSYLSFPSYFQEMPSSNPTWEQRVLLWQIHATSLCLDTVFALKTQESTNSNSLTAIIEQQGLMSRLVTTEGKGVEIDKVADALFRKLIVPQISVIPWCMLFEEQVETWFRTEWVWLCSFPDILPHCRAFTDLFRQPLRASSARGVSSR